MQALLRSNLPAIDSLRYAVTLLRDGTSVLSLCVTDIATWLRKPAVFLRKPAVFLAGTYYMDNLLSVNREVPGHMFLFSPIKVKCRILKKADLMAARNCQRSFI